MEDHLQASALAFLQPEETAAQFLARSFVEQIHTGVHLIDLRAPLRATHVVEISGLASTGKTEVLYSIAATCTLPNIKNNIVYGGHCSNVLYLDLDCKFDIVRMAEILHSRVIAVHTAAGIPRPSSDLITGIVEESIGRLHLISCPSSFHLLAALKTLKPEATRLSQNGGLAAVLVDNVTSHYYIDRSIKAGPPPLTTRAIQGVVVTGAGAAAGDDGSKNGIALALGKVHSAMVLGLRNLQHALRVPIIATKHVFSSAAAMQGGRGASGDSAWVYRDVMLKPWQEFVTHRLVLKKVGSNSSGGGGSGGARGFQGHVAKWIKPEVPVDDRFRVDKLGIVASS